MEVSLPKWAIDKLLLGSTQVRHLTQCIAVTLQISTILVHSVLRVVQLKYHTNQIAQMASAKQKNCNTDLIGQCG